MAAHTFPLVSSIEAFIIIILLLLAVPDICARLKRPALLYTIYLIVGLAIGPFLTKDINALIYQVGRFGFILVLFEIGLEIDLPPVKRLIRPAKLSLKWIVIQFPIVLGIARWIGLSWSEAILASAALNACSVSMTFLAWQHFPAPNQERKMDLLLWMVTVEIVAIVILTAGYTLLSYGIGIRFFMHLAEIAILVIVISLFADRLTSFLGKRLISTVHLKGHYIALFIFLISALGARIGLSESKTAFFLGLFISRSTHEGIALSHHLRPIGQNLLIPIFFVSLGASVPAALLTSSIGIYAIATAAVLFLLRDILHRTIAQSGCERRTFLILCPNLTVVALAAQTMIEYGSKPDYITWIILTGLIMSIGALPFLPARKSDASPAPAPGATAEKPAPAPAARAATEPPAT